MITKSARLNFLVLLVGFVLGALCEVASAIDNPPSSDPRSQALSGKNSPDPRPQVPSGTKMSCTDLRAHADSEGKKAKEDQNRCTALKAEFTQYCVTEELRKMIDAYLAAMEQMEQLEKSGASPSTNMGDQLWQLICPGCSPNPKYTELGDEYAKWVEAGRPDGADVIDWVLGVVAQDPNANPFMKDWGDLFTIFEELGKWIPHGGKLVIDGKPSHVITLEGIKYVPAPSHIEGGGPDTYERTGEYSFIKDTCWMALKQGQSFMDYLRSIVSTCDAATREAKASGAWRDNYNQQCLLPKRKAIVRQSGPEDVQTRKRDAGPNANKPTNLDRFNLGPNYVTTDPSLPNQRGSGKEAAGASSKQKSTTTVAKPSTPMDAKPAATMPSFVDPGFKAMNPTQQIK